MATAKHKFHQLVSNPANQKLIDFLDVLQKLAKDAVGVVTQAIIEQSIYDKMPPYLKKSINKAHLENGTYEQIVSHLERDLEMNGLEAPDELQINSVTQQATQQNSEKPKPTCQHCKIQVTIETNAVNSNETKTKPEITRIVPTIATIIVVKQTPNPTINFSTIPPQTIQIIKKDRRPRLVYPPCETCG